MSRDLRGQTGTLTSSWTRRLVACAGDADLDMGAILDEVGIHAATLSDPQGRVGFDQHAETVARVAQRLGDPGVGVDVGAGAGAADFGIVGLLAESCETLRDALDVVRRFNALANEASHMDYWVEPGRLFIQDAHLRDGRPAPPALAEATFAFYTSMIRQTCGIAQPLAEVRFAHARHGGWTPARADHFDARLRFGQALNVLVLPSSVLDARLTSARPDLSMHLSALARRMEGDLAAADDVPTALSARVRQDLARGQVRSLAGAARGLGTSARTLQRELAAAGLTYRDVVDAARRELAPVLLSDRGLKVEAVAEHLGYSDARAFRRACVRWFGVTPGHRRDLAFG
ncbi:MAG: AraC family transcriptional regulator ligand-binding domain-containing protein [Polyangiaceae bacterium]